MKKEFEKVTEEYKNADVSEKWINYIHELDLESLNNERRFYTHAVFIEGVKFSDDEDADESNSPLYKDHSEHLYERKHPPKNKQTEKPYILKLFDKLVVQEIEAGIPLTMVWYWIILRCILLKKPENTLQPFREDLNSCSLPNMVHG